VLYGNLPPREISMKDVFRSGDSSKKFKIAEGQWYRYAPSYVSPAYHLLEGDRKSGSAGMPRPISYAVFCLKKKKKKTSDNTYDVEEHHQLLRPATYVLVLCTSYDCMITSGHS